jgi:hypothetical protein
VRNKLYLGVLLVALIVVCAGVVGGLAWWRWRGLSGTSELLARVPAVDDAVVLYVDFDALRRAGALGVFSGPKTPEEPEYSDFVKATAFDYRRDLDAAIVAFRPEARYFLVRGRFDWRKLEDYARSQAGACRNSLCRMQGSAPERSISFFPLRTDVLALAVGRDASAASNLMNRNSPGGLASVPSYPLWLSVPGSRLREAGRLPSGTRLFAKVMERAERLVLALSAKEGGFDAVLEAECIAAADASRIVGDLQSLTRLLNEMIAQEKQSPNPGDLSGVLTAGAFRSEGPRVLGRWPLPGGFLESLAGGSLR